VNENLQSVEALEPQPLHIEEEDDESLLLDAEVSPEIPVELTESKDGITLIPDRVYFRIGDVAEITGIKPYVLRFWEKEFEMIHPVKNNSGQRIYRKSDVEAVILIKRLLYVERFSIEGAKKRIKELRKHRELGTEKRKRGEMSEEQISALLRARRNLHDLIDFVDSYRF
jgi:DNA-binding transcriptional MerR regulator